MRGNLNVLYIKILGFDLKEKQTKKLFKSKACCYYYHCYCFNVNSICYFDRNGEFMFMTM